MKPGAANHVRIARPSRDLAASERFWVGGLGLEVLFRADHSAEGGRTILEYWIPAQDLAELKSNIVGRIELVAGYHHGASADSEPPQET